MKQNSGALFRSLVESQPPLQILGTVNAYSAILAERNGAKAIYLSGGGVAACSLGIPDLGITTMEDVLTDARRITAVSSLPLLADIDVGWGGAFNISRTIREMCNAGVAAVHMEDQIGQKRCGHRPNKEIVPTEEMVDRIKAAADGRTDDHFVIMARTDALANEGMDATLERIHAYVEAGADMIFPEAVYTLEQYAQIANEINVPILANITEFGQTPLFTRDELSSAGVGMILYPLSAYRAMSNAAINVYKTIVEEGTQQSVLDQMQTREELYDHLGYYAYEDKLDCLFKKS